MEASFIMSPLTIVDQSQSPAKKSRTKAAAAASTTTTTTTRASIIAATTITTTTTTTTSTATVETMKPFIPIRRRLSVANTHHDKGEKTRKSKKENEAYLQAANRWAIIKGI